MRPASYLLLYSALCGRSGVGETLTIALPGHGPNAAADRNLVA